MTCLVQRSDRYLHAPRLMPVEGDATRLTLIAWDVAANREHVLEDEVAPDGSLGPEPVGPACLQIVTLTRAAGPSDTWCRYLRGVGRGPP